MSGLGKHTDLNAPSWAEAVEKSGMLRSRFEHQQAEPQGKVLAGKLGWPRSPCNPASSASGSYTDTSRFIHSQTRHEFKLRNFG